MGKTILKTRSCTPGEKARFSSLPPTLWGIANRETTYTIATVAPHSFRDNPGRDVETELVTLEELPDVRFSAQHLDIPRTETPLEESASAAA